MKVLTMNVIKTNIDGVLIIEPRLFRDASGYFFESFSVMNSITPEADGGISILDDTLGIDWKIPTEYANLSEKDTKHEMQKDFDSPF